MPFGKRLRLLMRTQHWSQHDLAHKTGISQSFISTICRGEKLPSLESAMRICEALGVTPNDLLLGNISFTPAEKGFSFSMEEELLISKIRALSARDRNVITFMVDSMLSFGQT